MKTLAIIPARGGSKRLPGKNVRSFLGMPLIEWSIRFALKMDRFDRIIVSTDSESIAEVARKSGAEVHMRPKELATDEASSVDVALDVLGPEYDLVALLQPTSPVRDPKRWVEAFELIKECDAVIGVTTVKHSFNGPASSIAGNLYLIRSEALKREKTFRPERTVTVVCDEPCEAFDIDTEADWIAAEALTRHYAGRAVFGAGTL